MITKAETISYNVVVLVFNETWLYQGVEFTECRAQNHYDYFGRNVCTVAFIANRLTTSHLRKWRLVRSPPSPKNHALWCLPNNHHWPIMGFIPCGNPDASACTLVGWLFWQRRIARLNRWCQILGWLTALLPAWVGWWEGQPLPDAIWCRLYLRGRICPESTQLQCANTCNTQLC